MTNEVMIDKLGPAFLSLTIKMLAAFSSCGTILSICSILFFSVYICLFFSVYVFFKHVDLWKNINSTPDQRNHVHVASFARLNDLHV